MLHFFRKIRHDLIANSKSYKYFKYAIGEIVLVVLGILIALYINNWNEERKNEEKQLSLLANLKNDLDKDILAHMEIHPYIKDRMNIPLMDVRFFIDKPMKLYEDMLSMERQVHERLEYVRDTHTAFLDLSNYSIQSKEQIEAFEAE